MRALLPILLLSLSGLLAGGSWSMYRQGAGKGAIGLLVLLAAVSGAAGVLWLIPAS